LVGELLDDLSACAGVTPFEVLLTLNIPEALPFSPEDFPYPVRVIRNDVPAGFGANHNAAFRLAAGQMFCVMNPDIRLAKNPFPLLLSELDRLDGAVIAPITLSPSGQCEDSVRRFPSPFSLAMKVIGAGDGRYPFARGDDTFTADWVGGMFMLFRAEEFRRLGGFDEGFFLYYEDVDICTRLWKIGGKVLACPQAEVVHHAQRTSRRQLRYMRWHVSSMARYFAKHWLRLPRAVA
jgi:GT2 family glycosyltransferase